MNKAKNASGALRRSIVRSTKVFGASIALAALAPSAFAGCNYVIDNQWNSGFVAKIEITNTGTSAVNGWNISWQYAGSNRVSSHWNANLSGANPYSASDVGWNGTIQPGQSISFGFQGTKGGSSAEIPVVTGAVCDGGPLPSPSPSPVPSASPSAAPSASPSPVPSVSPSPVPSSTPSASPSTPPGSSIFRVNTAGNITKDGTELPMQCGNWFGLEGQHEPANAASNPDGAPMELNVGNMWWANTGRTIQQTITEIKAKGINVIRLPIAPQTLDPTDPQGIGDVRAGGVLKNHESVQQVNSRQGLEDFITQLSLNNIDIIMDIHSCSNYVGWRAGRLDAEPPWADADRVDYDFKREGYSCGSPAPGVIAHTYNETIWLENLREIARLPSSLGVNNIIGIDIFNEPWDYTWQEWKTLSEKAFQAIDSVNPNLLIFVEGISAGKADGTQVPHGDESSNPNWGENFFEQRTNPLQIPKERLVISPHTYGPSVFVQPQFIDQTQPGCAGLEGDEAGIANCNIVFDTAALEAGWDEHFGYLRAQGFAMVVGEFGGNMDWPNGTRQGERDMWSHITPGVDKVWQETFVAYMKKRDISACYWSINPESADTGGLYLHSYDPVSNPGGWGTWLGFDNRKWDLLNSLWAK